MNDTGSLSAKVTCEIKINANTHIPVSKTISDAWRTPNELAIMRNMVISEHAYRESDNHILGRRTLYHGVLHMNGDLHCFALAGGMLSIKFRNLGSHALQSAVLNVLAIEPNSDNSELVAHHLRKRVDHNGEVFSESDVLYASNVVCDYWKWRSSTRNDGMIRTYAVASVIMQNMFRHRRSQVPSSLQRNDVARLLLRDKCHEFPEFQSVTRRDRIMLMEMQCNIFVRRQVVPMVSSTFKESETKRTGIHSYLKTTSLPFSQAERERKRCPVHFGRGEPLLDFINEFVVHFKSLYTTQSDAGPTYMTIRRDSAESAKYRIFNRNDLYEEWVNWAKRMDRLQKCSIFVSDVIQDETHMETLKYTIAQLLLNYIAPGLCEYIPPTQTRHKNNNDDSKKRKMVRDFVDDTHNAIFNSDKHCYARFERVYPLDAIKYSNEIDVFNSKTAEERIQIEGHPLLEIAEDADRKYRALKRRRRRKKHSETHDTLHIE